MKRVSAVDFVEQARKLHQDGDLDKAEYLYHQVLNHNVNNLELILQIAQIHHQRGNLGLAVTLYQSVVEEKPDFWPAWNNLGICLKLTGHDESAEACFLKAIEIKPDNPDFASNISSIYVNRGQPDKIIEWADKAIGIGPEDDAGVIQAKWHKSLALLEKKEFETAWDYHESRLDEKSGCKTEVRNYSKEGMTPWWDGKSKGLVVIHGEQGLGDEIMFSSCLPEAINTGAEIVLECAPRLEGLLKRSFPDIKVVGTHNLNGEDWLGDRKVDFKCAIGSLPKFYRRSNSSFPGKPFLKADPIKSKSYRERLYSVSNRPKIGITWQGGVIRTRVDLRSIYLPMLKDFVSMDADFVSLQYHPHAIEEIKSFKEETGIEIIHWKEAASGKDMDDQAALISELDAVVTVCQTAVHVSGGLGIPTFVLTPSKPSWRYGISGNMPWYESVKLYRQVGEDWGTVIQSVKEDLCLFLKTTESKTNNYTLPIQATG